MSAHDEAIRSLSERGSLWPLGKRCTSGGENGDELTSIHIYHNSKTRGRQFVTSLKTY